MLTISVSIYELHTENNKWTTCDIAQSMMTCAVLMTL